MKETIEQFLARGGSVQQLSQNCSAAQQEPAHRKKAAHIDYVKRSDPRHPGHRNGR
jgi:hypothetical protein